MVSTFGCLGNTIKTFSGIYFDLANPNPKDIRIEDIANALGNICRFGGHSKKFYSVAEHSMLCTDFCSSVITDEPSILKAVLLHDATEAYCSDIVKPLKNLIASQTDVYERIEAAIEDAIAAAFNVDFESNREIIKRCDRALLICEKNELFESDGLAWTGESEAEKVPVGIFPSPFSSKLAAKLFLAEFHCLGIS